MIVWTIQPYKVYQKIMDEGIFFCNLNFKNKLATGLK